MLTSQHPLLNLISSVKHIPNFMKDANGKSLSKNSGHLVWGFDIVKFHLLVLDMFSYIK